MRKHRGEAKQNTGHDLEVQNEDLYVGGFWNKPREDWFSFAVNKTSHKTSIFSPELTLHLDYGL